MKSNLVLCLVPVLSGGLLAFANTAQSNPIADRPQPKQSLRALQFDFIHMIDREIGWAQVSAAFEVERDPRVFHDNAIWRTTNGGKSWNQVWRASPGTTWNVSAFFLDSKTGWVAVPDDESTNVTILRTEDGGRTWSQSHLRENQTILDSWMSFSSADQGWLMLIPDHTMNWSPADLYRTSNGGADWKLVNSTTASLLDKWEDEALPEFNNKHPYLVCGGPITFQSDLNGWMFGKFASYNLFGTRDGGRNWQVQRLPLPASLASGRMSPIGLPRFFQRDGNEGILPAGYKPTNNSYATNFATVICQTHDGGLNWQPTTPVKFWGIWSFITFRKGWIWSHEPHSTGSTAPVKGTLYRTEDGGVSWKPTGLEKGLEQYLTRGEDIVQLDFVDQEYGWAIARDGHNLTQLLQTTDGGETWVSTENLASQ